MSIVMAGLLLAQADGVSQERMNALADEARARFAVLNTLLDAMHRHDRRAFAAAGGDKVAFGADPEANFSALMGAKTPRLRIDAFDGLAACTRSKQVSTAAGWFTVSWDCPPGGRQGDTQFAFKFAGHNLVAIQAVRQPPKVKLN